MAVSKFPRHRPIPTPRIYRANPLTSKRSSITSISRRIRFLPLTPRTRATKLPSGITFIVNWQWHSSRILTLVDYKQSSVARSTFHVSSREREDQRHHSFHLFFPSSYLAVDNWLYQYCFESQIYTYFLYISCELYISFTRCYIITLC